MSEKGPAVLFEKPINSFGKQIDIPVLVNLFGTVQRVAKGINKKPDELNERTWKNSGIFKTTRPPEGWKETINMIPLLEKQFLKYEAFKS